MPDRATAQAAALKSGPLTAPPAPPVQLVWGPAEARPTPHQPCVPPSPTSARASANALPPSFYLQTSTQGCQLNISPRLPNPSNFLRQHHLFSSQTQRYGLLLHPQPSYRAPITSLISTTHHVGQAHSEGTSPRLRFPTLHGSRAPTDRSRNSASAWPAPPPA